MELIKEECEDVKIEEPEEAECVSVRPSVCVSWSVDEVQTFLSLVAQDRIQRQLIGSTRNEKVFQEVAQLLAAHGYQRTYKQCRDKLKKLKSDYRSIKDNNSRGGSNRRTWRWFEQMHSIYRSSPAGNGRRSHPTTPMMMEDDSLSPIDSLALSPCNGSTSQPVRAASPTPAPSSAPSDPSAAPSSAPSAPSSTPSAPSSTSWKPERVMTGKRKRSQQHQEHLLILREMQVAEVEQQELNRAQRERHLQMALDEARLAREQEMALRAQEHAQITAFNQAFLSVMGTLVQAMSGRTEQSSLPD